MTKATRPVLDGGTPARSLRVVVVDDSATVRAVLARALDRCPQIRVVGRAADGVEALKVIAELEPDVVTLDIEMPRMDGLEALRRIMAEHPTAVVMVSSLTREGAEATLTALELGAVDFVQKPVVRGIAAPQEITGDLVEKVLLAGTAKLSTLRAAGTAADDRPPARLPAGTRWANKVVVVGSSTGGPQALRSLIGQLPADLGVPIVVVQHMPAQFTKALAGRLDELSAVRVREARPGSKLERGTVLIAPGGFHLIFDKRGLADLSEAPTEHGVRPSVNVTMESLTSVHRRRMLGVVLTGMGRDGQRGRELIKAAGGQVLAQSEASCTVYGMPRAVFEAGLADEVVSLARMPRVIVEYCKQAEPARKAS